MDLSDFRISLKVVKGCLCGSITFHSALSFSHILFALLSAYLPASPANAPAAFSHKGARRVMSPAQLSRERSTDAVACAHRLLFLWKLKAYICSRANPQQS